MKKLFLFFTIIGHLTWRGNVESAEMKDLPSCIQAEIFKRLSGEDLLTMRSVSKKCKEVVEKKILSHRKLRVTIAKEQMISSHFLMGITESLEITTGIISKLDGNWIQKQFSAKNAEAWTSLKTLTMQSNKIDNDGAKAIANFLLSNSTVTFIDLSYNYIKQEGAYHLMKVIEQNKTLISMNLYGNDFLSEIPHLNESLKKNKTLIELTIENSYPIVCIGSGMGGYIQDYKDLDPRINSDMPKRTRNDSDRRGCIVF